MTYKTLLNTPSFREILEKMALETKNEIIIFSPFIKIKALKWLFNKIKRDVNVKIITRLSLNDVLQKVSDFEICQFANDNGWKIGLIENLHAKIYLFDKYRLLIGSNNLTIKGIGLKTTGNEELSIFFKPNTESIKTIDNILLKTHWLNQEKIELMADYLKNNKVRPLSVHYRLWPKEIYND